MMGLGPADTYVGSVEQNMKMIRAMRNMGYARGIYKTSFPQMAMTQENGLELISNPKLGLLTPLAAGSTVFTAEQTKNLWSLSKNPGDYLVRSAMSGGMPMNNSYSINVSIDRVQDYNDFVRQLQADPKFDRMIQKMTIDRLNGGSAVAKRRISF